MFRAGTELTTIPLLILDDLGMRKLPSTVAEDLREIVMRRYERASTLPAFSATLLVRAVVPNLRRTVKIDI